MTIRPQQELIQSGLILAPLTPRHWKKTALKYLAKYKNGYPFKPEDWGGVGLPIIRISQLTSDGEPNYFSGEIDEELKVVDGDLLFSWSATIDSYIWNGGPAWLNQHIFKVTPTNEADRTYLYYLIKHVAPKLADVDAHGSTMRHIKKESLGEKIYVPDIEEQRKIAFFLDRETAKIDALLMKQEELVKLLRENRQAIISQAVTKGLNPDIKMRGSGIDWLGDVPAHWIIKKIKHIAIAANGLTYSPEDVVDEHEGVLVLRSSNIQNRKLSLEDNVYVRMNIPSKSVVRSGDILICSRNGSRALIGKNILIPDNLDGVAYGAFMMLLRSEISGYLYWVLNSNIFEFQSSLFLTSTINQLTVADLYSFEIPIPPLAEQKKIISYLTEVNSKFEELEDQVLKAIELNKERRSALISAAVTGQIDVRNEQLASEAA